MWKMLVLVKNLTRCRRTIVTKYLANFLPGLGKMLEIFTTYT